MIVLPNKSAAVWDKFLEENKVLVYKFIIGEIKKNLYDDKENIELFTFEDGSVFAWIPKKSVLQTLDHAIEVFVEHEEYELAQKVSNLIKRYHVEKLLSEIHKEE